MSFLEIYFDSISLNREKELRILSCEQICGKHLRIDGLKKDISDKITELQKTHPNKCHVKKGKNIIRVVGPNSKNITINAAGKSNWYLIRGIKSSRKKINLLCLGNMLWGMEISSGLRMKKSTEKYGEEQIGQFLIKKVKSIFEEPQNWNEIQIYHHC